MQQSDFTKICSLHHRKVSEIRTRIHSSKSALAHKAVWKRTRLSLPPTKRVLNTRCHSLFLNFFSQTRHMAHINMVRAHTLVPNASAHLWSRPGQADSLVRAEGEAGILEEHLVGAEGEAGIPGEHLECSLRWDTAVSWKRQHPIRK